MSYSKVIIVGRCVADATVRELSGGKSIANFTVAIRDSAEESSFIDCKAWNEMAEFAGAQVKKGTQITLEGRLKQEKWEDKQTGQKRSKICVIANDIQVVGAQGQQTVEQIASPKKKTYPASYQQDIVNAASNLASIDDLPF